MAAAAGALAMAAVWCALVGLDLLLRGEGAAVRRLRLRAEDEARRGLARASRGRWRRLATPLAELASPAARSLLARRLQQAGRAESPEEFLALRLALAAAGFAGGLLVWPLGVPPAAALLLAGLGWAWPALGLDRQVAARQRAIRRELPLLTDLLSSAVAAGMELTPALARIAARLPGPLGAELRRAWREMAAGRARIEALEDMAERTGVEELEHLVASLRTADRYGVPVARALAEHGKEAAARMRARAEERAQTAGARMLLPLMLCVFLPFIILLLTPAFWQAGRLLQTGGRG